MALLLGTDIGAQSLKVGIMDEEGVLHAFAQVPYSVQRPHLGWAEEDPEVWWASFCKAVKIAMERNSIRSDQIESIGISTMCPSLVAMDERGDSLRPAILYLDQRSLPQAKRIQEEIGLQEIFHITGNRIAPGTYSVTSMLWMQENEPDLFRRTRCFGHGNTFLAHRLTGRLAFDWTNASFTGLFQTGTRRAWSDQLCHDLRIPLELLPSPVISSTCIGTLTERASRATELPAGIPTLGPESLNAPCSRAFARIPR